MATARLDQEGLQDAKTVLPVFFKNRNVLGSNDKPLSTLEICREAEAKAGEGKVEGAQQIRGLWRIYITTEEARASLLISRFTLRGVSVDLYDANPFVIPEGDSSYVAVHDMPLSYSDEEILKWLRLKGFVPVSDVRHKFARDENNKLTNFKTGTRFLYVRGPTTKLPRKAQIGLFTVTLWSPGQEKVNVNPRCSNCLQTGHQKIECTSEVVCLSCKQPGHRRGECDVDTRERVLDSDVCPSANIQPQASIAPAVEGEVSNLLKTIASYAATASRQTHKKSLGSHYKKRPRPKSGSSKDKPPQKKRGEAPPDIDTDWESESAIAEANQEQSSSQMQRWLAPPKSDG